MADKDRDKAVRRGGEAGEAAEQPAGQPSSEAARQMAGRQTIDPADLRDLSDEQLHTVLGYVFEDEWTRLEAADRLLIYRDCRGTGGEDPGVVDFRDYQTKIGRGNLQSYAEVMRARFAKVDARAATHQLLTDTRAGRAEVLTTDEDRIWLHEVHLKAYALPPFAVAVIYGNEDCPTRIDLFAKNDYREQPIASFTLTEDHRYQQQPGGSAVSRG